MDIFIKKSEIHGKGIFANKDFKKGEVVVNHIFRELTEKEYHSLSEEEKHFVGVNKNRHILFLPPTRYVNHSCDPNTFVRKNADVALRDIKRGEELTTFYSDDDLEFKMECTCGSKNCKRIIENK